MDTTAEERVEKREREKKEKYEERKEDTSYYREMDDDRLLEEVALNFPGCPDEMCLACLDNEKLIDELRRRIKSK